MNVTQSSEVSRNESRHISLALGMSLRGLLGPQQDFGAQDLLTFCAIRVVGGDGGHSFLLEYGSCQKPTQVKLLLNPQNSLGVGCWSLG